MTSQHRDFDNPWEWKRFMLLKWLSLNPEWRKEQQVRFDKAQSEKTKDKFA